MSRRQEWDQQVLLAALLDKWLDPACSFWTATDPVAPSVMSGVMRKRRGVKPGVCDVLVWYKRRSIRSIGLELKAPGGRCSASQRKARVALLRAGVDWWECRSAHAAMYALRKSGVRFRTISHADGRIERWRQPKLASWEVPRRDPSEPLPNAPEVMAQRRAADRRYRMRRRRAREIPQPAAAHDDAAS